MFKKILLTIIGISVLFALYIRLFGTSSTAQPLATRPASANAIPSRTPADVPQTKVRFAENPLAIASDGNVKAEVFLQSNENKVTAVHFEIGYDPKVFTFEGTKA